jgi:hypothetical protein
MLGWNIKDLPTKNFLKIETSDNGTDPRNISPRSDAFLSSIGPYVSSLEHACESHPALVKGMSLTQRDSKLAGSVDCGFVNDGLSSFNSFFETDYSRFDLSISAAYIRTVERIFLASPFLQHLDYHRMLPWLVQTVGISDLDLTYTVLGTRCSGDAHTSIMNGLINHFNTWICLNEYPANSWISYHEGDDALIATRGVCRDQTIHNLHFMPVLGFQLKLDVFNQVSDTSFCGRMLYENDCQLKSHCDLMRTLVKYHTICADGDAMALLLAKSMSYYHTDRATPLIGPLCTTLIKMLQPLVNPRRLRRALDRMMTDYWYRTVHSDMLEHSCYDFIEPDIGSRVNVMRRCGLTVEQQMRIEEYYRGWLSLGHIPDSIDQLPVDSKFRPNMSIYGL